MDVSANIATDAAPHRRAPLVFLVLFILAAIIAVLWWRYAPHVDRAAQIDALQAQVDKLNRGVAQLRGNTDTFRARLDDGDKVDASVRQQLLALGQRVQVAEDAVANLADRRLSGHDALALDEAELLLTLGGERYTLFHDAPATIAAYQSADAALAEVDDAAFSTVRQTIAGEIAALQGLHAADPHALGNRLAQIRAQLDELPRIGSAPAPAPEKGSTWLGRLFDSFVQVRRDVDAMRKPSAVRNAALARDLVVLDLQAAQVAALARDEAGFRAALAEARMQIAGAFDTQAPQTAAVLADLDAQLKAPLAPAPPAVLGAALKELRNLRATHALSAAKSPAPKTGEAKK